MAPEMAAMDGNEAVARVAHKINEVIAIYPITPSSPMGEWCDLYSSQGKKNIWGTVPLVSELQSEGGASGSIHGALQGGSLATTFTASQGLLLMIPNMYKIAGELTPTCFHVSARSVACQALSIFGDHSDVMATRQTGFALLASNSVQEAHDMTLIGTAASLRAKLPFLHFFDGFRTSHEVQKIETLDDKVLEAMVSDDAVLQHRKRGLLPDRPFIRGTAQNPDVFFQGRETVNKYYDAAPAIVQEAMDEFAKQTGRQYKVFDYVGHPEAEKVVILMGSGAETAKEAVEHYAGQGEKLGLLQVRLYRPFSVEHFIKALPQSCTKYAVLDRTKEPGSIGEPLYEDVRTAFGVAMQENSALFAGNWPKIVGGRYGLSSKEFTPAMIKGVFDNLDKDKPKDHFTVGIYDDVTETSLPWNKTVDIEPDDVSRCLFYGLGSDGTVGANKNSIKIIGEHTDMYAQGYFVYDSKKAGAMTVSHLRFGPRPIRSTYLIKSAQFIACHQWPFIEKYDILKSAKKGGTFLLNSVYGPDDVWRHLPKEIQKSIIDKELKFYVVDAGKVAEETGMGVRINTIMQTCFFAISGVLPKDEAITYIKKAIEKTYGKKGEDVVQKNFNAVDQSVANLHEVNYPKEVTSSISQPEFVKGEAPEFVRAVTEELMAFRGDDLPVSKMPEDGTFPTGTTKYEKRNIARDVPIWEPDLCIQCGKCSFVCPHATIRMKIYPESALSGAPAEFKSAQGKAKYKEEKCTVQVFPEDCTGCGQCVFICPAKDKENPERKAINMTFKTEEIRERERQNAEFFLQIPEYDRTKLDLGTVKESQLCRPLFEFSGACAGCGETPYYKLATQLFGDRMIISNATGCSSIYGGNLPTTPFTVDPEGRGPVWSNSLFEDNAEFGYGFALTRDKLTEFAREIVKDSACGCLCGKDELVKGLLEADQTTEAGIREQRARVAELKKLIAKCDDQCCKQLREVADYLVKKSVWIVGGDGWAYDIGYGGLDHVLAQGRDVNVLVMDTEVYSNTGGQASKATPTGATAKFAMGGKSLPKKDLGMIAMTYGYVYVARCAMGYNDAQTVKAFIEAESYPGPSLILCYSHCIAQGIPMNPPNCRGMTEQKKAVESGSWTLLRYDPRRIEQGENPLRIDSKPPSISYKDYAMGETRFSALAKSDPETNAKLMEAGQTEIDRRNKLYQQLADLDV